MDVKEPNHVWCSDITYVRLNGKSRAMDNIFIERLWRSVKYEKIYTKDYSSAAELVRELKNYFDFYNYERTHQSLDDQTPAEVYWGKSEFLKAA